MPITRGLDQNLAPHQVRFIDFASDHSKPARLERRDQLSLRLGFFGVQDSGAFEEFIGEEDPPINVIGIRVDTESGGYKEDRSKRIRGEKLKLISALDLIHSRAALPLDIKLPGKVGDKILGVTHQHDNYHHAGMYKRGAFRLYRPSDPRSIGRPIKGIGPNHEANYIDKLLDEIERLEKEGAISSIPFSYKSEKG